MTVRPIPYVDATPPPCEHPPAFDCPNTRLAAQEVVATLVEVLMACGNEENVALVDALYDALKVVLEDRLYAVLAPHCHAALLALVDSP